MDRLPVLLGFGFVLFLLLALFPKSAFATHGTGYSSCADYSLSAAQTYCTPDPEIIDPSIVPNRVCSHESVHDYNCPNSSHTTTFLCRYSHVTGCAGLPQSACSYSPDTYNCYQYCNDLSNVDTQAPNDPNFRDYCGNYYLTNPLDVRMTCDSFRSVCYSVDCVNANSSCPSSSPSCSSNNCSSGTCNSDHQCVSQAPPTVALEVKQGTDPNPPGYSGGPITISDGSNIILRWTTSNAPTSCTASGDWTGSKDPTGGDDPPFAPSPGNHTYTITCTNPGGTASDTVQVSVSSLPSVDLKVNNQDGPSSSLIQVNEALPVIR